MNCPNCGTGIFADQPYCRSCGSKLTGDERRPFNLRAWGLTALMLIFGGLLTAMGAKMAGMKWLLFTGLVITFAGMFAIAAFGLIQQTRPRKSKLKPAPTSHPQPEMLRADTTNKLLPIGENDFIPSVVEDTTELLKTPAPRKAAE